MRRAHTQVVGIVGAGPAGLTLCQLLHLHGIDTVIVEDRSRDYVEARVHHMLHRPENQDDFDLRLQISQLRYVTTSHAAATSLAESYVGLESV